MMACTPKNPKIHRHAYYVKDFFATRLVSVYSKKLCTIFNFSLHMCRSISQSRKITAMETKQAFFYISNKRGVATIRFVQKSCTTTYLYLFVTLDRCFFLNSKSQCYDLYVQQTIMSLSLFHT